MSTVVVNSNLQSKSGYRTVTSATFSPYDNAVAFDFSSVISNTIHDIYIYQLRKVGGVIDNYYYGFFTIVKNGLNVLYKMTGEVGSGFAVHLTGTTVYVDFTGDSAANGSEVRYSIEQVLSDTPK
jgi:hypothetical protein